MHSFSFGIVTSEKYIDETIGLIYNLSKLYPKFKIIICALDFISSYKLKKTHSNVKVFSPMNIWGDQKWKDMIKRMTVAETAYASKSGLADFILRKISKSVLIMDSDLLFLSRINDILKEIKKYDVTLFSSLHPPQSWKKTRYVGIFSAGLIGFSESGKSALKWWKESCYEKTRVNIFEGLYNEQKYLDYMLGVFNVKIIRDYGVNISATQLGTNSLVKNKKKEWIIKNTKTKVRIFHNSRVTSHEIYDLKNKYIKKAYEEYLTQDFVKKKEVKRKKIIRINFFLSTFEIMLVNFFNTLVDLKRFLIFIKTRFKK